MRASLARRASCSCLVATIATLALPCSAASRPSMQARSCISASDRPPAISATLDSTAASANRLGACSKNGVAAGPAGTRGWLLSWLARPAAALASSGTDRIQRSWRPRPAGSCRSTTCTLLPPRLIVDTAASRGPASQSRAACGSTRRASPLAISSCGRSTPDVGGTTPVPSASTVLISPAAPAAALACPMFALTEPSAAVRLAPDRIEFRAVSSAWSSSGVPAPFPSMN